MFSSIQSIPGLIFARSDVKAKIRPGVEARSNAELIKPHNQPLDCCVNWLSVNLCHCSRGCDEGPNSTTGSTYKSL